MAKAGTKPPTPTRRTPLSRERIARSALELIDDEGLESCSMRRLGARLGVEAMALYHHFPSKGDLLDGVVDCLLEEVELPASGTPRQRLRACIRSYRACAIRHPPAFVLLAARRFNTERAFAFYEALLGVFGELGLTAQQSARWFRLIGGFASGAGMADVASRERIADATPLRLERAPELIAFPRVRAVAPHLSVKNLDSVFEFGLDVLFDALAAQTGSKV
ncbi:TetR/AcrR family transcriptional regulator [Ramlibacter sp. WS9]|uniref:TetR/AcrR family transcriptional regulator n=1 Tax=Ramlibacter sp. WS9 TaxID=1882741 RepID=UPI001142D62B|nr:TetR/AcrR family transcriptional regulator C-terminal domain-containing protein [Ramlibacter sp. WS9]ROZ72745.1 TetR/AcrR family transcriptional regulator [Ramlibacter sp. WS9]